MLRRVDRLIYRVESVAAAARYWRDVLGLTVVHEDAKLAVLRFPEGGTEVVLHADREQPAEAAYFLVDDVRDLHARRAELQLQFVSPPMPTARGYRAAARDPFGNVLLLIDRTLDRGATPPAEDAKPPGVLFAGIELQVRPRPDLLAALYERVARTADDLPYTPHFETIYAGYIRDEPDPKPTRAEVWRHLLNLRKSGKLARLGEARTPAPDVEPAAREKLRQLLGDDLGRRDRLPYTPRFDHLAEQFNRLLPRPIAPHLLWRLIATIAK
jgi:catechol 2,3-dioxygenase-like lactoylglutathione lyase family enzyme